MLTTKLQKFESVMNSPFLICSICLLEQNSITQKPIFSTQFPQLTANWNQGSNRISIMVEKRKPLILSSTKNLLNSLLNSETQTQISLLSTVQLRAGILQVSKDASKISNPKFVNFDDSALVGLTTSQLRRLCVTSGSLV